MRQIFLGAVGVVLAAGVAFAQPSNGTGAASGNDNQAVATTSANAPAPAKGSNSFTLGQARRRIQKHGYSHVTGLHKDNDGVWRGQASKDGNQAAVWLDYKGNVGSGQP